jgi:hypothetical protein
MIYMQFPLLFELTNSIDADPQWKRCVITQISNKQTRREPYIRYFMHFMLHPPPPPPPPPSILFRINNFVVYFQGMLNLLLNCPLYKLYRKPYFFG